MGAGGEDAGGGTGPEGAGGLAGADPDADADAGPAVGAGSGSVGGSGSDAGSGDAAEGASGGGSGADTNAGPVAGAGSGSAADASTDRLIAGSDAAAAAGASRPEGRSAVAVATDPGDAAEATVADGGSAAGTDMGEGATATAPPGRRGRPLGRLGRIRGELPLRGRIGLGAAGLVGLAALWLGAAAATSGAESGIVVPSPAATWDALVELHREGLLVNDILASSERILVGYGISMVIGILVGLAMGAFPSAEGSLEAPIGFVRYIPASALTPLMLLWLGIDEAPKITLIVLGTVFYNILMVADVARSVPRQLVHAAATLGATRRRIMARVVWPHSVPGIIDVARINLASGWLMLVVAELLATDEGLAVRVARATRFRAYDRMFAILLVFGVIGMLSDLALRGLRRWAAPWDR